MKLQLALDEFDLESALKVADEVRDMIQLLFDVQI